MTDAPDSDRPSRRGRGGSGSRQPRPLDAAGIDRLALHYVGRYATTRAKLGAYLRRKIADRGWAGEGAPAADASAEAVVAAVVDRMAGAGYVDDRAFAEMRAGALARRGYGGRRVGQALRMAGIDEDQVAALGLDDEEAGLATATAYARRRRLGPFSRDPHDRDARQRAFAAMLRAGHAPAIITRVFRCQPDDETGSD